MPKYFPGITHSIVHTIENADLMKKLGGAIGHVDLCFGPGDANAIRHIRIRKMEGPTSGLMPYLPKTPEYTLTSSNAYTDIIYGDPADELKVLALKAFDAVKQKCGLKFNKTYRVTGVGVEELSA